MKIIWTELAVDKLEEFADYIALDKPSSALRWVRKIQKSVNKLKKFPEIGRKVPEIKRSDIREIIEGSYRIIYKIELDRISILTLRHCSQLLSVENISKKKFIIAQNKS